MHGAEYLNDFNVCTKCIEEGNGTKSDDGKVQWRFLFDLYDAMNEIAYVFMFGAKKYARTNYLNVEDARDRYNDALMRHVVAWYARGEKLDTGPGGSGRHHLAAAGCCLLILLAMDLRGMFDPKPVLKKRTKSRKRTR